MRAGLFFQQAGGKRLRLLAAGCQIRILTASRGPQVRTIKRLSTTPSCWRRKYPGGGRLEACRPSSFRSASFMGVVLGLSLFLALIAIVLDV